MTSSVQIQHAQESADFTDISLESYNALRYESAADKVLQCVAACCSVSQRVAVCRSVLQCVAACCSVLLCVAMWCGVVWRGAACESIHFATNLLCVRVQCVAVV